jgi:hypothetical protein
MLFCCGPQTEKAETGDLDDHRSQGQQQRMALNMLFSWAMDTSLQLESFQKTGAHPNFA